MGLVEELLIMVLEGQAEIGYCEDEAMLKEMEAILEDMLADVCKMIQYMNGDEA